MSKYFFPIKTKRLLFTGSIEGRKRKRSTRTRLEVDKSELRRVCKVAREEMVESRRIRKIEKVERILEREFLEREGMLIVLL